MSKFQNKYRIETARLKHWDYSTPWWYYVTIATTKHTNYFGEIKNKMHLNHLGKSSMNAGIKFLFIYNSVDLDQYIIMPNHDKKNFTLVYILF